MSEQANIRFLGDVERLVLKPDDIVVLKTNVRLSAEQAGHIQAHCKTVLGEDRKILVISAGIEIGILAPEAA